jgi:anti-sigma factor RsiW
MHCPDQNENREWLVAYAAGRLDPESARRLEAHLAECQICRAAAADQAAVWQALDLWEAPPVSPDFDRRLYRRVREGGRLGWWERLAQPFHLPLRQAVPLAAAACLLLVASLIVERPARLLPPPPRRAPVRVEQVERTLDDLEMLRQFDVSGQPEGTRADTL